VALSQQHRSSLYLTLSSLVGTEEAEALLSEFPANDRETPATKDFVRAEAAVTRAEVHQEIGALRVEMHALFRRQTMWTAGLFASGFSVMTAVNAWLVLATR
jgi:hypothetical protein